MVKRKLQKYEIKNRKIEKMFEQFMAAHPETAEKELKFSWSNWGFGREELCDTCGRLSRNGIHFIELHGNHYGRDLGYRPEEIMPVLAKYGIRVSGVCGMFSPECDLSAPSGIVRQNAVDYLKREIEFTKQVGGEYLLIVPAAVGRPVRYDDSEEERSLESLSLAAELFIQYGIKGAVEPIRAAETSIIHTVDEALSYIRRLNHPGVRWINGDVFHMQAQEEHIGEAILRAGEQLVNLHMADSNRGTLGSGFLDLDTVIRALYLTGYEARGGYVTPEPLGAGGDPYPAMHGRPDKEALDRMVSESIRCFREREGEVKKAAVEAVRETSSGEE